MVFGQHQNNVNNHHGGRDALAGGATYEGLHHTDGGNHKIRDAAAGGLVGGALHEHHQHQRNREMAQQQVAQEQFGNNGGYGTGTGAGLTGTGIGHHHHHNGVGAGATGAGLGTGAGYAAAGPGTGTGVTGNQVASNVGGSSMAANAVTGTPSIAHGKSTKTSGKVEKVIGSVLCSTNMKVNGQEKIIAGENEVRRAEHIQHADRLESQAAAHRAAGAGY